MVFVEVSPFQESDSPDMIIFNKTMDLIEKNKHSMTASKQSYIKKQINKISDMKLQIRLEKKL